MSETATIASSDSGGRPALDLSATLPITRSPNLRLTGSSTTAHESFLLRDKFIYTTTATAASKSPSAVYHLSTRCTRSGVPWQLAISHLLPSETRRLSSSASSAAFIKYDDDLTLYTGEKLAVPFSLGPTPLLCIRGRSLPGVVVVDGSSRAHKFWHMTPRRRPLTSAEEDRMQALMHKRGYRTSDDWRKELLYTAARRKGNAGAEETEWTDARGVVVARESDGQLVVGGGAEPLDAGERDLLIACWASRHFVQSAPETVSAA